MVQNPSNAASCKLGVSSIAPPLPPRRLNKDSGGCLLPSPGGGSSLQASTSLPPPPPIPSHNESFYSHGGEENKPISSTLHSQLRRTKTDIPNSSLRGPLPLPPTEIATSKNSSFLSRRISIFLFLYLDISERL